MEYSIFCLHLQEVKKKPQQLDPFDKSKNDVFGKHLITLKRYSMTPPPPSICHIYGFLINACDFGQLWGFFNLFPAPMQNECKIISCFQCLYCANMNASVRRRLGVVTLYFSEDTLE